VKRNENNIIATSLKKLQQLIDLASKILQFPLIIIKSYDSSNFYPLIINALQNNALNPEKTCIKTNELCKTVIESFKPLIVSSTLINDKNIEIQFSYAGFPIFSATNKPFGTFCLYDSKEIAISSHHKEIIKSIIQLIELELKDTNTSQKQLIKQSEDSNRINTIESHIRQKEALTNVAQILNTIGHIEFKKKQVLQEIGKYTNASQVLLFKENSKDKSYHCHINWMRDEDPNHTEEYSFSPETSKEIIHLIDKKKITITASEDFSEALKKELAVQKASSFLLLPIFLPWQLYGFIKVHISPYVKQWNKADLSLMKSITDNLSNAIKRRQAEVSLKKSKEQAEETGNLLQTIINAMQAIIFAKDTNGHYLIINNYFSNITGLSKENIIGRTDFDIYPQKKAQTLFEKDQLILNNKKIQNYEEEILHSDGSIHNYLTTLVPLQNNKDITGICKLSVDISERKKAEHALIESEERLDLASKSANIGLWDYYPQQGKILINEMCAKMLGYNAENFRKGNKTWSETKQGIDSWRNLVHPEDLKTAQVHIYKHLNGESNIYQAEYRMKCKDGKWKWIMDTGQVIERNEKGEALRMNGVHIDINETKKLQTELQEAVAKARTANRTKSEFLASISHEIRTPMNAIIGFSELADHEVSDPMIKDFLQSIKSSGQTLLNLINDVLDLSKIEAGKMDVFLEPVNLTNVLLEIKSMFRLKAKEKSINLELGILKKLPALIEFDELKIRQILINLVNNAIKFTDKGFVKISADYINIDKNHISLTLKIQDSGIGIPEYLQDSIFESFRQQDGQDTKKYEGSGLGLAITKNLIKLLEGKITLISEIQKGSTFTVYFPMIKTIHESTIDPEYQSINTDLIRFEECTILVVDDIKHNRELIKNYLKDQPVYLIEAENALDAFQVLNQTIPDLILMDLKMPDMDGYEATSIIKKEKKN